VTYAARRSRRWLVLAAGLWVLALLNVIVPHVAATLVLGRYAPGVATAVAIDLPLTVYLIRRATQQRALSRRDIVVGAAIVVPAVVLAFPLLFTLGRVLAT
jgi:hypothetical protein